MKTIVFVAVVMNWFPVDKWWIVDGTTREACQGQEGELRAIIGSKKEDCISVYVWQHEKMQEYLVQWQHAKGK